MNNTISLCLFLVFAQTLKAQQNINAMLNSLKIAPKKAVISTITGIEITKAQQCIRNHSRLSVSNDYCAKYSS